ncbi:MAG: hypothetical protein U0354_20945 [Candidatus Sericytochromatia bacterium]
MIIKVLKENDGYRIFYMNGDPKGKFKTTEEIPLHEKLIIEKML